MNKQSVKKSEYINGGLVVACFILLLCGTCTSNKMLSSYNNRIEKITPDLSKNVRKAVLDSGDSTLNARISRYEELIADYNTSAKDMSMATGILGRNTTNFKACDVEPWFADTIGVKNLKQYKKYLRAYEHDSLATQMRNIAKRKGYNR